MDTLTLAVCNMLFLLLYAGTTLVYRTMYRGLQPGVRGCDLYIASNLFFCLSFVFIFLPDSVRPLHPTLIAVPLGFLGRLLLHRSFAELMESKDELWKAQISVAVVGLMAWAYNAFFTSSPQFGWIILAWGLQYVLTGLMLFRLSYDDGRMAAWLGGSTAIAHATAHLTLFMLRSQFGLKENPGHTWPVIALLTHGAFAMSFLMVSVSRLHLHMQSETERDELTQLVNRRGLRRAADAAIARCRRKKISISVLMIDLDGFKKANDLLGHEAGDVLLCAVSRILMGMTRGTRDKLARLGGDEFCILLPGAEEQEAVRIAERCRLSLMEMRIPYFEHELNVSASFGVAHSSDSSEDLEELLHCSDVAMYEAKRAGRNCVAVANMRVSKRLRLAQPKEGLRRTG